MKMYNNGQRPTKMYGGGMASPRKPMQMGGLAQQNRKMTTGMAGMENPMGRMTEKKRYDMGMKKGGKLNKGLMALKKEAPDVVKKMGFKKAVEPNKYNSSTRLIYHLHFSANIEAVMQPDLYHRT